MSVPLAFCQARRSGFVHRWRTGKEFWDDVVRQGGSDEKRHFAKFQV